MTYIKTVVVFAPILISTCAIMLSAYNLDIKGLLYMVGIGINTFIGWCVSQLWSKAKPGMSYIPKGQPNAGKARVNRAQDLGSVNCNIFGLNSNWGKHGFGSCPDTHALFLAFTVMYVLLGSIENGGGGSGISTLLFLIIILSGGIRIFTMNCCHWEDVFMGWFIGSMVGFGWFAAMRSLELSQKLHITYFNEPTGNTKCNLTDKEYKCDVINN
jgi:hypothetical protein